ncbi:hypothetical protein GCM10023178_26660 [Actinomadura luteofluorescens]
MCRGATTPCFNATRPPQCAQRTEAQALQREQDTARATQAEQRERAVRVEQAFPVVEGPCRRPQGSAGARREIVT